MKAHHFLYFVDASSVTVDNLNKLPERLQNIIPPRRIAHAKTTKGPGGSAGVLFCALPACVPAEDDGLLSYVPAEQTWRGAICKEGELPQWYVGFWNDAKPRPQDIERSKMVVGYEIELEYETWQVPLLRMADGGTMLPRRIRRNAYGAIEHSTLEAHETLAAMGLEYYQQIHAAYVAGKQSEGFSFDRLLGFSELALGLNYHVGQEELDLLGVWSTTAVERVAGWAIDLQNLLRSWESEKNAQTGAG